MSPITSRYVIIFALISSITSALAAPQLLKDILAPVIDPLNGLTILKNAPPQLMTPDPSPECAKTNQGALLCCESTFDGGFPLVRELSELTGYELSNDTINGFYCEFSLSSILGDVS
jgi:hypothetical protein